MMNWLKKNELILWKLSSIQMKILNDITYNLNWIDKFQIELNSNFIEKKEMQICEKDIQNMHMNMVLKNKIKKTEIPKDTFSCFFTLEWSKQIQILKLSK
jgi:hypothetical protein